MLSFCSANWGEDEMNSDDMVIDSPRIYLYKIKVFFYSCMITMLKDHRKEASL
jgi:hypothetical protein